MHTLTGNSINTEDTMTNVQTLGIGMPGYDIYDALCHCATIMLAVLHHRGTPAVNTVPDSIVQQTAPHKFSRAFFTLLRICGSPRV